MLKSLTSDILATQHGLTKREVYAISVLQGIGPYWLNGGTDMQQVVRSSFAVADLMLAEGKNEPPTL